MAPKILMLDNPLSAMDIARELASSYSTGTTNSIMASTVSMRDFTGARTRAVCMAAAVTGAAELRPLRNG